MKINFQPFQDQKPGTSGLRKKTPVFMQDHYVESFVQATLDPRRASIVIGGDGRYYNVETISRLVAVLVGNEVGTIFLGQEGLMSTPAMSACIRARKATGGFILSASHNPGGPEEDFGIKFNISNGGPAPASFTEKLFEFSKGLSSYEKVEISKLDLDAMETKQLGNSKLEVISSSDEYVELLQQIFDFDELRDFLAQDKALLFDGMNAVTGPYAKRIFIDLLGAEPGSVMRGKPLTDFGGCHPDPNQVHAAELIEKMSSPSAPKIGAASDGDGDRNLILGPDVFVSPGDSLAVIAAQAQECIPDFKKGISGVARSMPTSRAVDRVAKHLEIACFETPTGWKFFGSLLDANQVSICGEESFGTSSSHIREKDGLWAVLAWLTILAKTKKSVGQIMLEHWEKFGRNYFQRHDYENISSEKAGELMNWLRKELPSLPGQDFGFGKVMNSDDFSYEDPINGSFVDKQGIRIVFDSGARCVLRQSGTGTSGATLRIYLERFSKDSLELKPGLALQEIQSWLLNFLDLNSRINRSNPCITT